jgi:hypothetical protein
MSNTMYELEVNIRALIAEILARATPNGEPGACAHRLTYLKGLFMEMASPAMEQHLRLHLAFLNGDLPEQADDL